MERRTLIFTAVCTLALAAVCVAANGNSVDRKRLRRNGSNSNSGGVDETGTDGGFNNVNEGNGITNNGQWPNGNGNFTRNDTQWQRGNENGTTNNRQWQKRSVSGNQADRIRQRRSDSNIDEGGLGSEAGKLARMIWKASFNQADRIRQVRSVNGDKAQRIRQRRDDDSDLNDE